MNYPRYKNNPFTDNLVIPIKDKRVQISKLGKDNNVLLNQATGEVFGTHITTFKRVDGEQFVKLFTQNIALTFDLSSAGIKAFNVLIWAVQYYALSKDQVDLDTIILEEFLDKNNNPNSPLKLSSATFKRGLNELEKAQIIAKTIRQGRYFINPNFVFNGDRIAFSTIIERQKSETQRISDERFVADLERFNFPDCSREEGIKTLLEAKHHWEKLGKKIMTIDDLPTITDLFTKDELKERFGIENREAEDETTARNDS